MSKIKINAGGTTGVIGPITSTAILTNDVKILTVQSSAIRVLPSSHLSSGVLKATYTLPTRLDFRERQESLPILPMQSQGYYLDKDNISRWYFPEIILKSPSEGGFLFKCQKEGGVTANGGEIFKAELTMGFRIAEPAAIRALRDQQNTSAVYKAIPITYAKGAVILRINGVDTPLNFSVAVDPSKSDFEVVISNISVCAALYRTLSDAEITATLHLETQFSAWYRPGTSHLIELAHLAPQAKWSSGELIDADNVKNGSIIPWQGGNNDGRGFARLDTVYMEDGRAYKALRTHPKWADKGTVKGHFPWKNLPANARFEAKIGFLNGARFSDGVTFQVWEHHYDVVAKKTVWNKIVHKYKPYDGKLLAISANLSHLKGQSVGIELRVDAGTSSGQDWAAWIEPRITGDEYERKVVTEKRQFKLSYPCSAHANFYRFKKADGTFISFGCTPPWSGDFNPNVPYVPYNKVNLSQFGISQVFKSSLRDDQFLLVPARYVIARDANGMPETYITVKADLETPEQSAAMLDMMLAPDISDFQMIQIKKALVKSYATQDISKSIDLMFPSIIHSVDNPNQQLIPVVNLNGSENYSYGVGNMLNLSLQNLVLHDASLVVRGIDEALGYSFAFRFTLGSNMPPVPSVASLTFKDLAGNFANVERKGNNLEIVNYLDRDMNFSQLVVETQGQDDNLLIDLKQSLKADEAMSIELPESARAGKNFAAAYSVAAGTPYEIKEMGISTDEIRHDLTVDFSAFFKDATVKAVEITVQMKQSSNNIIETFNASKMTGILALRLPISFYLASRVIEYALRISYHDVNKPESVVVRKHDLRESPILVASADELDS
jgi:hypothetical protein